MAATRTHQHQVAQSAYSLPAAQRQAILDGSDYLKRARLIASQREHFMAKNNGFEYGQENDDDLK